MSDRVKHVARVGLRWALLAILLGLFSQGVGGQKSPTPVAVYLLRAVYRCAQDMDLEGCSAADLKKVGWSDQSAARDELAEFTELVLAEAQRQQARVKRITCNTSMPLKKKEDKLVEEWKRLRGREDTRPWIIEMQIKVESGNTYSLEILARRAGQDDIAYPEFYKTREPGEFGTIIRQRHYPDVAKLVAQVGCDILNGCEER